jgi:hypothetical protein
MVVGDLLGMNLIIKLKCIVGLRRFSYVEEMSLEEWNMCPMLLNRY